MTQQGRCTLPAGEAGRVLDRLTLLEKVIRPELVRQVLLEVGRVNQRACNLTHEIMMWVVLAMGVLTDVPIRQVFKHARRLHGREKTPHRSSLCVGRQRLGVAPVRCLFEQVVRPLATEDLPGAFYCGLRLVGLDGSVYNLPDSARNAKTFGRPSGGDRGEGAFPQLRKLSLVELGTRVELALQVKPYRSSEEAMVPALLKHLVPGMLLLWDRNFFSYRLWKSLISRGIQVLGRLQRGMVLKPIHSFPDGSFLAKIYPSPKDREKDRHGIVVRIIRYTIDDAQRTGHQEEHLLITTLLDADAHPAMELIVLYHERWEHEQTYDEQKVHQDPPRVTKPTHLRSETPAGVVQEVYALSLGHFVVRSFMVEAARRERIDPDRLSFTGCFQVLKCRLPECDSRTPEHFARWYDALLWELGQERTEPRRNRINPRVIRQKLAKWPKKRPEHRSLPPLTKTFVESVVMLN
jgi:hypothetical protein